MTLKSAKNFTIFHLLPGLVVFIITFLVVISLGALNATPGTFDVRKEAAEQILSGKSIELVDNTTFGKVTRNALATSITLATLFFGLTYVSTHPKNKNAKLPH